MTERDLPITWDDFVTQFIGYDQRLNVALDVIAEQQSRIQRLEEICVRLVENSQRRGAA